MLQGVLRSEHAYSIEARRSESESYRPEIGARGAVCKERSVTAD
jgi:hypothetical protein